MLQRVPQKETESGHNGRKMSDKRLKEGERHRRGEREEAFGWKKEKEVKEGTKMR